MLQLCKVALLVFFATAMAQEPPYYEAVLASDDCAAAHVAIESDKQLMDISDSLLGPDYDPRCDLSPRMCSVIAASSSAKPCVCEDKWNETAAAAWSKRCTALGGEACFSDLSITFADSNVTTIHRFDLMCRPLACNSTVDQDTEAIARQCVAHFAPDVIACSVKACNSSGHWEVPEGECLAGSLAISRNGKLKDIQTQMLNMNYNKTCDLFPGMCTGEPAEIPSKWNATAVESWKMQCKALKGEPCFMDLTVDFVNGTSALVPRFVADCFPIACDSDAMWHQEAEAMARHCVSFYDDAASCDVMACGHEAHYDSES